MSLGNLVNNLIKEIPSNASQEIKNYFKEEKITIKDDNTFNKYTKKKAKELFQLVQKGKINNVDFSLLLMQKLNDYLGENKDKILEKDSNLANGYKNFFTNYAPEIGFEKIYYEKYQRIKENIKKIKNQIEKEKNKDTKKKWVRAYPNKLKKQSTHLILGKSKLKALAAKDDQALKKMADENRLTVPDFRNILKYKLSNQYLGNVAEEAYKKTPNIFCNELQIFYDDFNFNKLNRKKDIENIYKNYQEIKKILSSKKEIHITNQHRFNADDKMPTIITTTAILTDYKNFKTSYLKILTYMINLSKNVKLTFNKREKWKNDILTVAPSTIHDKIKIIYSEDYLTKLRDDWLIETQNYLNLFTFNLFKLVKDNTPQVNLPKILYDFATLFSIQKQYEEIQKTSYDSELYILKTTKNKIEELIEKNNTENQTENLTIKQRAANLETALKRKPNTNKAIKNENPTIEDDPQNEKYRQEHRQKFQDVLDEIKNRKAKLKAEKEKEKEKEIEETQEFEEFEDNNDASDFEEDIDNPELNEEIDPVKEKTKTTKKRGLFSSLKHKVSKHLKRKTKKKSKK